MVEHLPRGYRALHPSQRPVRSLRSPRAVQVQVIFQEEKVLDRLVGGARKIVVCHGFDYWYKLRNPKVLLWMVLAHNLPDLMELL